MSRRGWAVATALVIGMAVGLGLFTFGYARGYSYLTNDPEACANCHIMSEHFAAWTKASHKTVATCNDCHTPHNLVGKYIVKAKNGFWHSFYFTTGNFPDPLRITEGNREVTEGACRYCHLEITDAIDHGVASAPAAPPADGARRVELAHAGGAPPTTASVAALLPTSLSAMLAQEASPGEGGVTAERTAEPISCIRCHRYVGHWVR